ncbi:MAG: hypothetical protein AB7N65_19440 [Vicinamibacterales bacterium]
MTTKSRLGLLVVFGVTLVSASCGERSDLPIAPGSPAAEPVVLEILGQADNPAGATGRRLTLVRYTIAPGTELVPHVHPGVQMASIVSGTLTYRVVSGTATIHRQVNEDGLPAWVETLAGPADTALRPGDAVLEEASMVHLGANRTSDPIVILATLVTELGADLSVPVSAPAD